MPTGAMISAGTTLAISATVPGALTESGFGGITFTDIGEVVTVPEYGKAFNLTTHNPLGDRQTYKFKSSFNNGSVTVQLAKDSDDAGQVIVLAAVESDNSYSFEVTLNDGTIQYFTAKVMSYTTNVGSVDQITGSTMQLEIDSNIVEVAA